MNCNFLLRNTKLSTLNVQTLSEDFLQFTYVPSNFSKDWIGNYKKKISGKKVSRVKRSKVTLRKKRISARDVFQEHYLRGKLSRVVMYLNLGLSHTAKTKHVFWM